MTDDYVSFETAKLLKEAGFDEPITTYYFIDFGKVNNGGALHPSCRSQCDKTYPRPTLSLAAKWLREVKHLAVMPEFCFSCNWQYRIYLLPDENGYAEDITVGSDGLYEAYEYALEAGLREALEWYAEQNHKHRHL